MSFFHLVEKNDLEGPSSQSLGELTALFVTNIPGLCTMNQIAAWADYLTCVPPGTPARIPDLSSQPYADWARSGVSKLPNLYNFTKSLSPLGSNEVGPDSVFTSSPKEAEVSPWSRPVSKFAGCVRA